MNNHDGGLCPGKPQRADKKRSGFHPVGTVNLASCPCEKSRTTKPVFVLCFRSPLAFPDPDGYQVETFYKLFCVHGIMSVFNLQLFGSGVKQ